MLICVTAVLKFSANRLSILMVSVFPERMLRLNDIIGAKLPSSRCFFCGYELLMQLLPWSNSNDLRLRVRCNSLDDIHETHGRYLWYKNFAPGHSLNGANYKPNALIQGYPKPSHPFIR